MTAASRSAKIESLQKSLRKHYKDQGGPPERSVFDHLIYACLAEDAPCEAADEAFVKLQQSAADYNDLRVTTVTELVEHIGMLPAPREAASRLKRNLQAIFDNRYAFELEELKKANMATATETLEAMKGMTKFVQNYVCQNALGGHTIPIDASTLRAAQRLEVISDAEAAKGSIPGLERAVPKNKGLEFAQMLHAFAVDLALHPDSPAVAAVFKDMKVPYTPAAPAAPQEEPKPAGKAARAKPTAATEQPAAAESSKPAAKAAKPPAAKSPAAKPPAGKSSAAKAEPAEKPQPQDAPAKKPAAAAKPAEKAPAKKPPNKPEAAKPKTSSKSTNAGKSPAASKTAGRSLTKKKPK